MIHVLPIVALIAYLAASVAFISGVPSGSNPRWAKSARFLFFAGFLAHTISFPLLLSAEAFPILDAGGDYYYLISWTLALFTVLLSWKNPVVLLGAVAAPVVTFLLASSALLSHRGEPGVTSGSNSMLVLLHVAPALIAEICLGLSFILSLTFLMQERRLKRKERSILKYRGPSLEALNRLILRCIYAGFIAMSIAIISGVVWALGSGSSLLSGDYRQWMAVATWIVLGLILHAQTNLGRSAHKIARFTALTAGLLFVVFFGYLIFSGEGLHGGI